MSRGYGKIERRLVRLIPLIGRPATVTVDGREWHVKAVAARTLVGCVYGRPWKRTQYCSVLHAIHRLAAAEEVRLFYADKPGRKGPRVALFVAVKDAED